MSQLRSRVDLPTLGIVILMIGGTIWLTAAHATGSVSSLTAFVVGVILANLSFTAWHEAAHGNFSGWRRLNTVIGWLSSFASIYPGYFARRREHLVHHKWQGKPVEDPVYVRIQTTFWRFPFRLARLTLQRGPLAAPASFLPITGKQRALDAVSNLLSLALIAASWQLGFGRSLLLTWIAPRLAVFLIHAYYICFFAHHLAGGGFELYRVRTNRILGWLTLGQSLHGVHHRWPSIPWHEYRAHVARLTDEQATNAGTAAAANV